MYPMQYLPTKFELYDIVFELLGQEGVQIGHKDRTERQNQTDYNNLSSSISKKKEIKDI